MLVDEIERTSVRPGEGPRLHEDLLDEPRPVALGTEGPARTQQEVEQSRPLPMRLTRSSRRYPIVWDARGDEALRRCKGDARRCKEVRAGLAVACEGGRHAWQNDPGPVVGPC